MKLVFLANTGDPSLLPDTGNSLESLSSLGHGVTDESSLLADNLTPFSGVWTGTPNALGLTSTVELVRSCATVALNLQASLSEGYEFQLKSVSVKNVPAKSYYLAQAERETLFPSTSEGKVADYAEESYAAVSLESSPQQLEWVIPANLRGTGTATKAEDKSAATAPEGQADYCTYIEIKGTYGTNIGGQTGALNAECTYTLYLGENLTDDYNVKPGYKYNLDATIKGANVLDARLSLATATYGISDESILYYYTDGPVMRWPICDSLISALPRTTAIRRNVQARDIARYVFYAGTSRGSYTTPCDSLGSTSMAIIGVKMSSITYQLNLSSTDDVYTAIWPTHTVGPLDVDLECDFWATMINRRPLKAIDEAKSFLLSNLLDAVGTHGTWTCICGYNFNSKTDTVRIDYSIPRANDPSQCAPRLPYTYTLPNWK